MIEIEEVRRLRLDPGDILVLKAPNVLTAEQCEEIRKQLEGEFPDNRVLVMTADFDLEVVTP